MKQRIPKAIYSKEFREQAAKQVTEEGLKIVRAIVRGERDPDVLALMRDVRCKASAETVRSALITHHLASESAGLERTSVEFAASNNCKDPAYR